jgi:cellulose synthase/poly-beta-1,6-N-acetylglucosamine synthase-like glycosyltransferase
MAGPVIYKPGESVLHHLLQFDIASLGIVSASMINLGIPVMCSGANMAYRRDAFMHSGGYSGNMKIASGDDSFLMHSIAERHPGSVKFIKDSSSVVQTQPPENWSEFFQQRKRWAGKWKYHSLRAIKWLAVFIFLVHLDFIYLAAWSAYSLTFSVIAILLAARILFEWILLKSFLSFAGCKTSVPVFLAAAILYPFYAVFFGILSNTATFTWKGRTYRH